MRSHPCHLYWYSAILQYSQNGGTPTPVGVDMDTVKQMMLEASHPEASKFIFIFSAKDDGGEKLGTGAKQVALPTDEGETMGCKGSRGVSSSAD